MRNRNSIYGTFGQIRKRYSTLGKQSSGPESEEQARCQSPLKSFGFFCSIPTAYSNRANSNLALTLSMES